jgi:hypothetical protein
MVNSHLREKSDYYDEEQVVPLTEEQKNFYSNKIAAPIYEPTGDKPIIADLIDLTKYNELCEQIKQSSLSEQEKQFLFMAASRHIVFNYENIANYYAHSDKNTQELFEKSALVIIDFNKAVQNGFVKLSKQLNESYLNNDTYTNDEDTL